jgi:serine/threonine protein kinase
MNIANQRRPCKKIGFGSYGQVFESCNENNVVKHVDKYVGKDKCVKSFDLYSITELVVLKKSISSNIPKVHSVSVTTDKLLIEMDNRGKTLHDFSRKLTFDQRCAVLPWVAYQLIKTALQLQVNGVIHNDIKSTNVVVDDNMVVSLIDFGICVFESVDKNKNNATSVSNSWGTYTICPPEMFLQGKWVPDKMMPWSIGITLCEFLFSTYNFLKDNVFDEKEKKLYMHYIKYDTMLKSLMSTAFNTRMNAGQSCVCLSKKSIPVDVENLIGGLLTFNAQKRITLEKALQLPIFKQFTTIGHANTYIVPDIHYHQIGLPLLQKVDCKIYIEHRQCCIQWMHKTLTAFGKLGLFSHAVSIFDRFLNKIYIHHNDYLVIACASLYIAQYIQKETALSLTSFVDTSHKVARELNGKIISCKEAEKYVELVLVVLDYDLYYRTIDTLLASQDVKVDFDEICHVMVTTLPPYNNMLLLRNYRKLLEERLT